MRLYVGIDCGATHLRVGLVDEVGQLLGYQKIRSPLKSAPDQLFEQAKGLTVQLLNQHQLQPDLIVATGLGTPGPLDLDQRQILHSSNIANSQPIIIPATDPLVHKPVYFDRDANVALLGEVTHGVAQHQTEVLMLTLGTGVGGAVMVNGKLVHGQSYRAGEIGHIYLADPANQNLPKCGMGHHGCLEAFIKSADLDQAIYYLGIGIANLINIFNPQTVVLSGGMMIQLHPRIHEIEEIAQQYAMAALSGKVQILPAALGDHAGVIGAAMLAMQANP